MSEISFKRVMSMDKITTALLISDDLDDHQTFTEAFQKILPTMVVIAVLSQNKAIDLLASKKLIPDFVFLDLTSPDSDPMKLLSELKMAEDGTAIPLTVYGNEEDLLINRFSGIPSFDKEYEFPQLVKFFQNLLKDRLH